MNLIKKIAVGLVAGIVVLGILIQFVPYGRDHTNPSVIAEPNWNSPETKALFDRACADCHSNETVWPWYSNIAPVSWLVQHDVEEGRQKLNVSEWGQGDSEAHEAAETVQKGEMPMPVFLITHPEARLSDVERQTLVDGLAATFGGGN